MIKWNSLFLNTYSPTWILIINLQISISITEVDLNQTDFSKILIPILSPEWIVSLTVRLYSLNIAYQYCHFIQLSKGGLISNYGDPTPIIALNVGSKMLSITSAINGGSNIGHNNKTSLRINQAAHIEVHQRYISGGNYMFFIVVDGVKVYEVINKEAQQFFNVKIFRNALGAPTCLAFVKNFQIINFLWEVWLDIGHFIDINEW